MYMNNNHWMAAAVVVMLLLMLLSSSKTRSRRRRRGFVTHFQHVPNYSSSHKRLMNINSTFYYVQASTGSQRLGLVFTGGGGGVEVVADRTLRGKREEMVIKIH